MPYREKTAWLSLIAMCAAFVPYFAQVAANSHPSRTMPNFRQLGLFALATIVQVAILAIGHAYLRLHSPTDATTPPDERDRAIASRSVNWAYYVLITGMIMVGCIMPFTSGGWTIVNAAIFTIVVAELVHYGMVVFSYRRQAA